MEKALNTFLSSDSILLHRAYLNDLKLKYSILEKSDERLKAKSQKAFLRMKLDKTLFDEAIALLSEIELHEMFFSSFSVEGESHEVRSLNNTSREAFIYEIFTLCKNYKSGFLILYTTKRGFCDFRFLVDERDAYKYNPKLCIDLYEHTYFSDYAFRREDYLKAALLNLNFSKLWESIDNLK